MLFINTNFDNKRLCFSYEYIGYKDLGITIHLNY